MTRGDQDMRRTLKPVLLALGLVQSASWLTTLGAYDKERVIGGAEFHG